jgi:hypothetical protein
VAPAMLLIRPIQAQNIGHVLVLSSHLSSSGNGNTLY